MTSAIDSEIATLLGIDAGPDIVMPRHICLSRRPKRDQDSQILIRRRLNTVTAALSIATKYFDPFYELQPPVVMLSPQNDGRYLKGTVEHRA